MSIQFPMLNDTINFISLAREVALDHGEKEKAERLTKVISHLQQIIASTSEVKQNSSNQSPIDPKNFSDTLTQIQQITHIPQGINSINERTRAILTMSAGGMTEIEIAKQLGISQEEVSLTLRLSQIAHSQTEIANLGQNTDRTALSDVLLKKNIADAYNGWQPTDYLEEMK